MSESPMPGENIPVASVPNLRDLGGWPTRDGGRVRRGLLYRSAQLDKLQDGDLPAFEKLGIRSVYDLRTERERAAQPDRVPEGAEHIVVDVLADSSDAAPAQLVKVLDDPQAATELLGGDKAIEMFQQGYRDIVSVSSALAGYSFFLSDLARAERRPALFHCTSGRDRTGWAAALVLMFFGVSDEDVMRDYLLTNEELLPAVQPVFDKFQAAGGDPELLRPVLGVQREYLEAAVDEMRQRFGTLDGYLTEGLKLDTDVLRALKAAFIEGGAS
jgi:protein-tyrosine phosphatase